MARVELAPGQNSPQGELKYVSPRDFAKELQTIADSDQKDRAVYTSVPQTRMEFVDTSNKVLGIVENGLGHFRPAVSQEQYHHEVDNHRSSITFLLHRNKITAGEYAKAIDYVNILEHTVIDLAQQFPEYKIAYSKVFSNPPGGKNFGSVAMHRDSLGVSGGLILIATFAGPRTWYRAADGTLIEPPASTVSGHLAHGSGIEHCAPDYKGQRRITVVVGLIKNYTDA